jgi:hypothetical protein
MIMLLRNPLHLHLVPSAPSRPSLQPPPDYHQALVWHSGDLLHLSFPPNTNLIHTNAMPGSYSTITLVLPQPGTKVRLSSFLIQWSSQTLETNITAGQELPRSEEADGLGFQSTRLQTKIVLEQLLLPGMRRNNGKLVAKCVAQLVWFSLFPPASMAGAFTIFADVDPLYLFLFMAFFFTLCSAFPYILFHFAYELCCHSF